MVFAARDNTITGHAFVVWGEEDPVKQQSSYEGFGYYPLDQTAVGNIKAAFGPVASELVNEATKNSAGAISDRLIVEVPIDRYKKSMSVRDRYKGSKYRTIERDCVTFVDDVAAALGLNRPARGLFNGTITPVGYVRALIASADASVHIDLPGGSSYDGPVIDGFPNGHGRYSAPEATYDGEFLHGAYEGTGTFLDRATGATYNGSWHAGQQNGHGVLSDNKTFTFDGNFVNGMEEGEGVLTDEPHLHTYKGNFSNGAAEGDGTLSDAKGSFRYRGNFDKGRPDGRGSLQLSSGASFEGVLKSGSFLEGTWRSADGTRYRGKFSNNRPDGKGEMSFTDGSSFSGNFSNGVAEGAGTLTLPDGSTITGTWHNGVSQGQARLRDNNGHDHSGHFDHGDFRSDGGGTLGGADRDLSGRVKEFDRDGREIGEHEIHGMEIHGGHDR